MMSKEGLPIENCKLHDPRIGFFCARAWPYKSYSENALFLRKSSLLPGTDQTKQVCSNDDQGKVYQNCNFHDPGAEVLVLGRGHMNHVMKMHYSFLKIFFFTHKHRADKLSI